MSFYFNIDVIEWDGPFKGHYVVNGFSEVSINCVIPDVNVVISLTSSIDEVRGAWEELERDGIFSPFQARAWLLPFYEFCAPALGAQPLFLLARGKTTARPLMLMPLCVRRRCGVRFVEWADCGVSDYNAPVVAADYGPDKVAYSAIWKRSCALLRGYAVLRLTKMPQNVGGHTNPMTHVTGLREMSSSAWGLPLPRQFEAFENKIITKTFAKELAKKLRRLAKRGSVTYETATSPEQRRAVFCALARQRAARFAELGRKDNLSDPLYRRFYEATALSPEASHLSALRMDGEIIAAMFALRGAGGHQVIMTTFEGGDWKSSSLGHMLLYHAIRSLIDEGIDYFDLTVGDELYKREFGAQRRPLFEIMQPLSIPGAAVAAALQLGLWLRDMAAVRHQTSPVR